MKKERKAKGNPPSFCIISVRERQLIALEYRRHWHFRRIDAILHTRHGDDDVVKHSVAFCCARLW